MTGDPPNWWPLYGPCCHDFRYGDKNPFWVEPKKSPHRCPVCEGSGKQYPPIQAWGQTTSIAPMPESCHGCNGTGIVWG